MIVVLLACAVDGGEDELGCVDTIPLVLQASMDTIDFGYVPLGQRESRSFTLTNVGPRRMRIDGLAIGDGEHPGFDLRIDDVTCVRTERVVDTGDVPFDEDDRDTGDALFDEDTATDEVLYLTPDCPLPLTVTYAPVTPGKLENAVVVWHDGDWLNDQEVIWLSGSTDGMYEGINYVVGNVIVAEEANLNEGESTRVSVRTAGDVNYVGWTVGDGGGTFDDPRVPDPVYTAAELRECSPEWEGVHDYLYAIISDDEGNQDWTFRELGIFSARTPLHGCPFPAPPCLTPPLAPVRIPG